MTVKVRPHGRRREPEEVVYGGIYVVWRILFRRCGVGGSGLQTHRRSRAGSAEGDIGASMRKKGLGSLLMVILTREGAVCYHLEGWVRWWLWKGRDLGREGRIVIDISSESLAGMRGVRTAAMSRLI
jgi:hypothetical protein